MPGIDFLGPIGGALAVAFGAGWVAGGAHMSKTTLRDAKGRIVELKDERDRDRAEYLAKIEKLEIRIQHLEDERVDFARGKK